MANLFSSKEFPTPGPSAGAAIHRPAYPQSGDSVAAAMVPDELPQYRSFPTDTGLQVENRGARKKGHHY